MRGLCPFQPALKGQAYLSKLPVRAHRSRHRVPLPQQGDNEQPGLPELLHKEGVLVVQPDGCGQPAPACLALRNRILNCCGTAVQAVSCWEGRDAEP